MFYNTKAATVGVNWRSGLARWATPDFHDHTFFDLGRLAIFVAVTVSGVIVFGSWMGVIKPTASLADPYGTLDVS